MRIIRRNTRTCKQSNCCHHLCLAIELVHYCYHPSSSIFLSRYKLSLLLPPVFFYLPLMLQTFIIATTRLPLSSSHVTNFHYCYHPSSSIFLSRYKLSLLLPSVFLYLPLMLQTFIIATTRLPLSSSHVTNFHYCYHPSSSIFLSRYKLSLLLQPVFFYLPLMLQTFIIATIRLPLSSSHVTNFHYCYHPSSSIFLSCYKLSLLLPPVFLYLPLMLQTFIIATIRLSLSSSHVTNFHLQRSN